MAKQITVTTSGLQFVAVDSHGNCFSILLDSNGDTVQVCGLADQNGKSFTFESEAYHFDGNAAGIRHAFKDVSVTTTFDFD